jgi:hypothetical protein
MRITDLDGYLIVPIQRLPRYRMLLESLTDTVSKGSQHYQLLCAATEAICEVTTYCNEKKRERERKEYITQLAEKLQLDPEFAKNSRFIVHEEVGKNLQVSTSTGQMSRADLYICNDTILIVFTSLLFSDPVRQVPLYRVRFVDDVVGELNQVVMLDANKDIVMTVCFNDTLQKVMTSNVLRSLIEDSNFALSASNVDEWRRKRQMNSEIVKEGTLQKRGHINRAFRARHFELRGATLKYFKSKGSAARGTIHLERAYTTMLSWKEPNTFVIHTYTGKRYYIKSKDEIELNEWVEAIDSRIKIIETGNLN